MRVSIAAKSQECKWEIGSVDLCRKGGNQLGGRSGFNLDDSPSSVARIHPRRLRLSLGDIHYFLVDAR